jgi:peptidoglycan/xylan/chitin deacetylase (PgdA/CDA1 family)
MVTRMDEGRATGLRGSLGELAYSTGMLQALQKLRAWLRNDLRILAYHRIMPLPDPDIYDFDMELISTSPGRFREQMTMVRDRFRPMRLTDVAAAIEAGRPLPRDAVVITFDDGYDDNYRIAFPILRELGIPATFFVSTGHIDSGKPFAYDWLVHMILCTDADTLALPELGMSVPLPADRAARRRIAGEVLLKMKDLGALEQTAMTERLAREWQLPDEVTPDDCRPMSWAQIREMHAAGFEFGSHGVHHRMLARLPHAVMEAEIAQSKAALDRELGTPAVLMSYPVGGDRAFNERVMEATRASGFALAVCYVCGTNAQPLTQPFALQRLPVERMMGPGWFAAMLTLPDLMSYPTAAHDDTAVYEAACIP